MTLATSLQLRAPIRVCILLMSLAVVRPASTADESTPARRPSGTREMLTLFGVDNLARAQWIDGRQLSHDDPLALLSVLYSVRRFEVADIERWTHRDVTWQQLQATPDRYRGEFVHLSGLLVSVEPIATPPELAARFELRTYYRCEIKWGEPATHATVFALEVPRAWLEADSATLSQQLVSLDGIFLANASADSAAPDPVFVAQRIAWQRASLLGRLGMDVGLFDTIENRHPLTRSEREVFYQMLAACRRADERELAEATAGPSTSVVPLFNKPDEQHGRLVVIEGTARRAVPIRIEEADLRERFGIDQYYEIEVFADDSQGNPLVFCVTDLPEDFPQGDRLAERVRIPAFFFKTWAYRSAGAGEGKLQLAPLLVGRSAQWLQPPDMSRSSTVGFALGGLFVVGLVGVWLAVWWTGRADRRVEEGMRARNMAATTPLDLDRLALEADAGDHTGPGSG